MQIKKYILSGLTSGLIFALLMAGWDYYNERSFSVIKFILHLLFFGIFNGYMTYRAAKRKFDNDQDAFNH